MTRLSTDADVALDKLHRFSFGETSEIERTDISFLAEQVRDELERLRESERQHAMGLEEAWRRGRDDTVTHALSRVDSEGMVDQHVLAIGSYRRDNPYSVPR